MASDSMSDSNASDRFGALAQAFHWVTFLLLLGSFGIGLTMVDMPLGPRKLQVFSWHKWVGVTVFLITVLRLGWRLLNPPSPYPKSMPDWQRRAARLSHAGLYTVLLVMPVSGWVMSSALGLSTVYLGLVPLPDLVAPDRALGETLISVHAVLGVALAMLFAVHVSAAIYHHIVLRDDVALRMLPFTLPGRGK
jgi:cytochrome b561